MAELLIPIGLIITMVLLMYLASKKAKGQGNSL